MQTKERVSSMADYAAMYKALFRAQSKAIEILQKGQQEAEEIFIRSEEEEEKKGQITLLPIEAEHGRYQE